MFHHFSPQPASLTLHFKNRPKRSLLEKSHRAPIDSVWGSIKLFATQPCIEQYWVCHIHYTIAEYVFKQNYWQVYSIHSLVETYASISNSWIWCLKNIGRTRTQHRLLLRPCSRSRDAYFCPGWCRDVCEHRLKMCGCQDLLRVLIDR